MDAGGEGNSGDFGYCMPLNAGTRTKNKFRWSKLDILKDDASERGRREDSASDAELHMLVLCNSRSRPNLMECHCFTTHWIC
jgi:hypothetical protein